MATCEFNRWFHFFQPVLPSFIHSTQEQIIQILHYSSESQGICHWPSSVTRSLVLSPRGKDSVGRLPCSPSLPPYERRVYQAGLEQVVWTACEGLHGPRSGGTKCPVMSLWGEMALWTWPLSSVWDTVKQTASPKSALGTGCLERSMTVRAFVETFSWRRSSLSGELGFNHLAILRASPSAWHLVNTLVNWIQISLLSSTVIHWALSFGSLVKTGIQRVCIKNSLRSDQGLEN